MRLTASSMRICLFLSVTWVAGVLCVVVYEFASYSPWCEYAGPLSTTPSCSPWFWTWYAKVDLPSFIAKTDLSSATRLFLPRFGLLLTGVLAVPIASWATAVGAVWIRSGSKQSLPHLS